LEALSYASLVAAGTVGAVVTAVWAIFYRDLTEFENRPILMMAEPGFNPPFYRKAPKKTKQIILSIYY
jgi:hypothetical protein